MSTNQPADAPLPPADAADDPPSPGRGGQLSASQQHLPQSSLSNDATLSPPPESISNAKLAESQPMTASSSSSSHMAIQDSGNATLAAVTYGTRSRNRNGATRPNYAEDQDKDLDFEITPSGPKNTTSKRTFARNEESSTQPSSSCEPHIPPAGAEKGQLKNGSREAKDGLPGMSSFSANPSSNGTPAPTASKKRKQPGSNLTNGLTPTASHHKTTRGTSNAGGYSTASDTNMMSFDNCKGQLVNGKLKADDGTVLSVNDHVYLICEPPGEPYYLARIMEFVPSKDRPGGPIESLRVNWYYRPKDVQKTNCDTRLVFATMHSDMSPITSLRGKCRIVHRDEIKDLDEYRGVKDSFFYNQLFDRYIHRYYEVIPTSKVINVPEDVKKVLDERWNYVVVESGSRYKELTSPIKTCKKCGKYAAGHNSVDCSVCRETYHMTCVRPVLTKKPTRGFGWACGPCSRAQERKLEARNTPITGDLGAGIEEEVVEEEEEDRTGAVEGTGKSTPATTGDTEQLARPATAEQMAQAKLWPYRYLGIHCQVEDALDYDDRIYPRAASRLGPRHQANVNVWHGRPVELVKPAEIKRKYAKAASGKRSTALTKETLAALEAEKVAKAKRPKWVMDEPPGFVRRGDDHPTESLDNTAQLMFTMPDEGKFTSRGGDDDEDMAEPTDRERLVDEYMKKARAIAPELGLESFNTNFLDKALEIFLSHKYNAESSLIELRTVNRRKDLKEPELNREEVKKFEEGVEKYGSELYSITKHVRTVKHKRIVRFYYMWKKTDRGKQIWGNWHDRKGKKEAKRAVANAAKLVDDVADDNDDSAFDNDKAAEKKRAFECKFCGTRSSRQWRRAPETAPGTMVPPDSSSRNSKDKTSWLTVALCQRCALLWRKYAIIWENMEEVAKKVAQGGGRAWKRRVDAELLQELAAATAESRVAVSSATAATVASVGIPSSAQLTIQSQEPPKKKIKSGQDKESSAPPTNGTMVDGTKKKAVEKPQEPEEAKPDPPRERTFPCAVCNRFEPGGEHVLRCRDCRLTVHQQCYGVTGERSSLKWICDMCANDRNPQVSTTYECILCPVTDQEVELFEAPKISHKKKSDRERERERKEREMVVEAVKLYRQHQHDAGRAENPREPLKKTSGNHWAHVTCSVWVPEVKFGNAHTFEPAEGFGLIPLERYQEPCKFCKNGRGPLVSCHFSGCNAQFHVGCAYRESCWMGFDITPVKSSRRDVVSTMKLGEELGSAVAGIWCSTHPFPTGIHDMSERDESGEFNALQLYAQAFKQADLSSTGTVRKASYIQQPAPIVAQALVPLPNRRGSAINGAPTSRPSQSTNRSGRTSPAESVKLDDASADVEPVQPVHRASIAEPDKKCLTCSSLFSPKWWPVERTSRQNPTSWTESRPPPQGLDNPSPTIQRFPEGGASGPLRPINVNSPTGPSAAAGKGDVIMQDVTPLTDRPTVVEVEPSEPVINQCHKCHIKKPSLPTMSAERPSSSFQASANSRNLQPRPSDYPIPAPMPSHSHPPPQPPGVGWPRHAPPMRPEWKPELDHRPHEYGHPPLRNGMPPAQPNGIPHAPPPPVGYSPSGPPPTHHQHMNGYPPQGPRPHHHPPPPPHPPAQAQYSRNVNGGPPLQFSPRQPTFPGRPFSASPPQDPHPHLPPHHSPPLSMQGPPRSYPPVGPPPPPLHHSTHREGQRPATPTADGRPGSSSDRGWGNINGAGPGAGASASPSVRNLLS